MGRQMDREDRRQRHGGGGTFVTWLRQSKCDPGKLPAGPQLHSSGGSEAPSL